MCPGAGFVVRGFGPSAAIPILRISRCTRLRLTAQPSARNIAVIRREPSNGQVVNSSSIRPLATLFNGAIGKDVVSRIWRKVQVDWQSLEQSLARRRADRTAVLSEPVVLYFMPFVLTR